MKHSHINHKLGVRGKYSLTDISKLERVDGVYFPRQFWFFCCQKNEKKKNISIDPLLLPQCILVIT